MPESSPDVVLEFGASFDLGENGGGLFRLAPIVTDDYDGDNSDTEATGESLSPRPSSPPNPRRISSCRTIRESKWGGSPSNGAPLVMKKTEKAPRSTFIGVLLDLPKNTTVPRIL